MRDWKTTAAGVLSAFAAMILFMPEYFPPWLIDGAKFVMVGGLASLGVAAKQFNRPRQQPTPQPKTRP